MVAIKDMEMPYDCWCCPLVYIDGCGYVTCTLTNDRLYPVDSDVKRMDDCPLMEIEDE